MLLGLFGVAYAFSFWFALLCIVVSGSSAAFGENVTLGFLSRFPSKLVNAWSSGTGMAGLLGATIYIIFGCTVSDKDENKTDHLKHLTKYAFLLTTPVVLLYWVAYFLVIRVPVSQAPQSVNEESDESRPILKSDSGGYEVDEIDNSSVQSIEHRESELKRIWRCLKLVSWLALNLCAVYVFEYVARGCAAKARPSTEYNIGCPELYAALQLCYQAGVFVSRSSVQMFIIKRVDILSLLQLINMVVWIVDVHYKFLPVAVLPAFMVYVGLLGGASYVNIFYLLLHGNKFPSEDRELCINIVGLSITLGIIIGTGLETLLFNTLLAND
ncbi:battenin-like isoform X2 [Gigantopelta aegis]|nr:battenin-like isoform X2 [Gigantopelta aegis]